MTLQHPYDDIEALALGGLEAADAQRLLDHADACPTCAVLLAEAMRAASSLEPPGTLPLAQTMPAATMTSPAARQRWLPKTVAWTAGLAVAAALVLAAWNFQLRSQMLPLPLAFIVHSHFEHHALRGAPQAGAAKVIEALDGSWLYVVGDGLEPNTTYELWETTGGQKREVGALRTTSKGEAAAYWRQPAAKIQAFALGRTANPNELVWP